MGKRLRFNKFILFLILEVIILIIAIWNNNKEIANSDFKITDNNKDFKITEDKKDFKITYKNEELDIQVDNKDFNISDDKPDNDKTDNDSKDNDKPDIDKTKETFLIVIDPGHGRRRCNKCKWLIWKGFYL